MIARHDQMMLAALQQIGRELKRANDLKEQEMRESKAYEPRLVEQESDKE